MIRIFLRIVSGVLVFLVSVAMNAQGEAGDPTIENTRGTESSGFVLQVGPAIAGFGGAFNTEAAEGRKTKADYFALPAASLVIYYPFGTSIDMGVRLDVGVSSTGTVTRPYEFYDGKDNWTGYFRERYTFFTLAPSLNLAGVTVGAGLNFPMSGRMWHPDRSSETFNVDLETMKSMVIDLRLGSMVKVWQTDLGTLFVELQVKYFVTGLYKENQYTMGNTVDSRGFPNSDFRTYDMLDNIPAGAQIGVSYLFDLKF